MMRGPQHTRQQRHQLLHGAGEILQTISGKTGAGKGPVVVTSRDPGRSRLVRRILRAGASLAALLALVACDSNVMGGEGSDGGTNTTTDAAASQPDAATIQPDAAQTDLDASPDATPASATYVPVGPYRRFDTRNGTIMAANSSRCWQIGGSGDGVPATATAVAVNLTVVNPSAQGYVTLYPHDTSDPTVPSTSTLNHAAGQTLGNGAIVALGDNAEVCAYTLEQTHLILDVNGYFPEPAGFTPVGPYRRIDTRNTTELAAGATRCWQIGGTGDGVPTSAKAVAINLSAIQPSAVGHLIAYPYDASTPGPPGISSLNYAAGTVVANGGIVELGDDSSLCVYSLSQTNVVIDVSGYLDGGADYTPMAPFRRVDTRSGGIPLAGSTRCYQVSGRDGIPASAKAIAINLTTVGASGDGFLRARPAGRSGISTSTLNFAADDVRANNAIVEPGAFGRICIYTKTNAHYILDVAGYWPGNVDPDPISHPHTFTPTNTTQFIDALEKSCCGDTLDIAPDKTIDITGNRELYVPGDVTIQGGRGTGVPGALIRNLDNTQLPNYKTWNQLRTNGDNVVIRDIRIQGPDGTVGGVLDSMSHGVYLRHDNCQVLNSELYHWPAAGVSTSGTTDALIQDCHIHDNIRAGRGYGVVVGSTVTPTIIDNNVFRRNRHSIAGSGYGSYIVRHNLFQDSPSDGIHTVVDMHGTNEHEFDNSPDFQAGIDIHIHHNDFEYDSTTMALIGIRGIPVNTAIIEDNCVARTDSLWVVQSIMIAYSSAQSGMSCYEKSGHWLCSNPIYSAFDNIIVRNNLMGTATGCR